MEVINFDLMKHPINWVTVVLMVFFAAVAFHLFVRYWQNSV